MCETLSNEEKCKKNSRELVDWYFTYNRKDRTNKNGGGWIVYFKWLCKVWKESIIRIKEYWIYVVWKMSKRFQHQKSFLLWFGPNIVTRNWLMNLSWVTDKLYHIMLYRVYLV
jgi:hypothetical protein